MELFQYLQENIGDIDNFVYEQWLLADLRDVGESSLPTDLTTIRYARLNETYALQVTRKFLLHRKSGRFTRGVAVV